ncbi:uncharacterized protein AB675_3360 [Cyphellophora attinorum]|uniref:Uncharacterized protein n=1 Tax=Cyphellophora attinorum TaxID=1664694 RepID=A0A0N1H3L9_9EURO|nr:uncharacterized protein AB675_3360 [Phialophora attinorum]KPI39635.1 hypothetical protein AB675_3360 [Phialophora attinorum]
MAAPPAANDNELITVIADTYNKSFDIPKSTLTRESGYFATLFKGTWHEVESGVIRLRGDHGLAMVFVLGILDAGADPTKFVRLTQVLSVSLVSELPRRETTQYAYDTAVGVYTIADKYDMPVLRKHMAELALPIMFKQSFDKEWPFSPSQLNFVAHVYVRFSEELGEYPEDLFDLVCSGAAHFLGKDGNADHIIEHISSNPKLLKHLIRDLVDKTPDNPQPLIDVAKQAAAAFRTGASAGDDNNGDEDNLSDETGELDAPKPHKTLIKRRGLFDVSTLCIKGVDEIVTVYNNSTGKDHTFKISKLALVTASGYFEAFFDKDWEEVRIPTIHIRNNGSSEVDVFRGALAEHGPDEFATAIDRDLIYMMYAGTYIYGEVFDKAVRMYSIADKYDMPALHKVLVESTFPYILEKMYEKDYYDYNYQGVFADQIYDRIFRELGTYPKDLYWMICKGVDISIRHDGEADYLIERISSDAQLLDHVFQYLMERVSHRPRLLAGLAKQIAAAPENDESDDVGEEEQPAATPAARAKKPRTKATKTEITDSK